MFPESLIAPDTIKAYRETEYHVFGDSPFTLRIGETNSALAAAHKRNCVESSAFITACNPNSKTLDDSVNAESQSSFRRDLMERKLAFTEGMGKHPTNGWPGEDSFLIFGVDLEVAKGLSRRLGQNAFVWAGSDCIPQLILLR